MLQASITFFILGIISMVFGFFGVAGISAELGETILWVFFIFALMSFLGTAKVERKKHHQGHN
jgi:uncharacterized membrane protein YtjA (UPF0391 family)